MVYYEITLIIPGNLLIGSMCAVSASHTDRSRANSSGTDSNSLTNKYCHEPTFPFFDSEAPAIPYCNANTNGR